MQESAHTRSITFRLSATALLVAVVAFFVDYITKRLARGLPTGGGPFPSLLTRVFHENYGLIANLPVPQWLILLLTVAVLCCVVWMLIRAIRTQRWMATIGLAMLVGGACGNLVDRLVFGYVFDWILLFERSAFNLADLLIAVGALLTLFGTRASSTRTEQRS